MTSYFRNCPRKREKKIICVKHFHTYYKFGSKKNTYIYIYRLLELNMGNHRLFLNVTFKNSTLRSITLYKTKMLAYFLLLLFLSEGSIKRNCISNLRASLQLTEYIFINFDNFCV